MCGGATRAALFDRHHQGGRVVAQHASGELGRGFDEPGRGLRRRPRPPARHDVYEASLPELLAQEPSALGHTVGEWPEWEWRAGAVCGVKVGSEGTRWAGADPRRGAHAIGR